MSRSKNTITLLLTGLVLVCAACTGADGTSTPAANQTIALADCQLSAGGYAARLAARCGTLSVPENRAKPDGRKINLNIAVIPAVSRNPAPDALFFLTGGPGQAATESYLQLYFAFGKINQKRDIILVDQRGTGKSNPLACENKNETEPTPDEGELADFLTTCLNKLEADPAQYTTSIAMQDLDAVRAALGYETINLYGVSYGTRAALTYLAAFPERVRAVILDGIVPQDEALGLNVAADAQRAVELIFERCQADAACREAFPGVRQELQTLLDRLAADPAKISLTHPVSGEPTEVTFTPEALATAIRLLSYTPETSALLPLLIHQASQQADFKLLAAQYLIVAGQLSDSISNAMGYSVLCAEDVPFITRQAAQRANQGAYLGSTQTDALFEVCQIWPRGSIPADFKQPVRSDKPVLILSGEADPVTPPDNGQQAAASLPNSLQVVAAGQGHNVIFRGCIPNLAADFIEAGSIAGLDASCVDTIQAMPFFTNFSGPQP